MQINEYINGLYRKAKEEEEARINGQLRRRLQKYDEQFKAIADRFEETDKMHQEFEDKTEANFKIAEQMLLAHSNCINQLDGRLVMILSHLTNLFTYFGCRLDDRGIVLQSDSRQSRTAHS